MYLFFDTETTGKYRHDLSYGHPDQPHIVQLAAQVTCGDGKVRAEMNVLIEPAGWEIPEEATAIHGIKTEDCSQYGIPIMEALLMFEHMAYAADLPNPEGFLVAHNMNFDMGMIRTEIIRLGFPAHPDRDLQFSSAKGYRKFCTMMNSVDVCKIPNPNKSGYKWPRLEEALRILCNREQTNAHDAMGDVTDCRDIFFALKKRWEDQNEQSMQT